MLSRPRRVPASTLPNDSTRTATAAAASASAATLLSILRGADPVRLLPAAGIAPTPVLLQHLRPALPTLSDSAILALARWVGPADAGSLLASRGLFAAAWRLLLSSSSPAPSLAAFAPLLRRYARLGCATAAVRAFRFLHRHPDRYTVHDDGDGDGDDSSSAAAVSPLNLAVDALCKEGYPRAAAQLVERLRREEPGWAPDVRAYNILLNGWSRARRLDKVEKLWAAMRHAGVRPTVVTYGTLIDSLCVMRRPDQAMGLLDQMRDEGIEANLLTCNPIVYALAQAGRFWDAHRVLEKFPLYGVEPNISTFNSLVLGYCKHGDLAGASSVLKAMLGRGISPTARTYNYFFMVFARSRSVELGMNLYSKMVNNGYAPDRLTYHLLIKMLCEANRLELTVQMIQEMRSSGFEPDLVTSTMLIHLLCRRHQFEEAYAEFEHMFERGIVPQYITYRMLMKELKRLGLVELVQRLTDLMRSVPHSTKLPGSYRDKEGYDAIEKKKSILQKAQAVSDVLKECKDPKKLHKLKSAEETDVEVADRIVANIRRRVYGDASRTGPDLS
ncbi:pentatricopeptide repeat-containing protein At5g11310, mitochondrial-like [Phragmites australis]|uniref:pentatricopeptide repeat-containing protein At5g11310, mitochondrial-like n=1 Tax=Phragmites australis TaxID=29695 RepID=UPI002D7863BA|nr:pentatricopeptide repeat-containing protein At5g11310, mitochondrial-like [Phragmites australis]